LFSSSTFDLRWRLSEIFFGGVFDLRGCGRWNKKKEFVKKNYKDVINNIYFQKTINHIFNNLTPRYKSINHKISTGETFDKILNSYSITSTEIVKIKKERADAIEKQQNGPILYDQNNGEPPIELNHQQVVQFIKQLQTSNAKLVQQNSQMQNAYNHLQNVVNTMEKSFNEPNKIAVQVPIMNA
jgi:hypothetical protein